MGKRNNWKEFETILSQNRITKLYHFTDRDNLESIIKNGGLYSWKDCEERGISIPKPGGGGPGSTSWSLDERDGLERYVRVSFTEQHPMMYVAMNENRISNPVILEIDPPVDDISRRRKGFYERNGFIANDYDYTHLPYHRGCEGHRLVIMSSPHRIDEAEYRNFLDYMRHRVMVF